MSACGCDTGGLKPVDEAIAELKAWWEKEHA